MALKTGKQRSVDSTRFAMVARPDVARSAFDVVHTHKTTFDAGQLIPIYVDEVLPGDSHRLRMTAFARLATPLVPLMDNLILESFFFFVPYRLVWDRWAQFMGEQTDPSDSTVFLVPQKTVSAVVLAGAGGTAFCGTIYDYLGISLNGAVSGETIDISALPLRAYNLIWNDWFRDEDIDPKLTVDRTDGPDMTTYVVQLRRKRHDYFTSARPWPQKPINAQEIGRFGGSFQPGGAMSFPQSGAPVGGIGVTGSRTSVPELMAESGTRQVTYNDFFPDPQVHIRALPSVNFPDVRVLINDIRTANVVQLMMERNARGGTRYTEIIRSHFGVVSPDARLQRPEYLGGGRTQVVVNPIAQQSASGITGSTTVLGELAGVGTAVASGHGFSQSFTEHGVIIGLVSVRADLTYQQGINRFWFRRTQFDFYWPALANLGEQAVLSKEIFANGTAGDNDVFGYQERWSEYKYAPNRISGRFRSFAGQTLDVWHLAQNFSSRPTLSALFMQENPPVDRVLQVGGTAFEQFLFDSVFDVRKVRPMPMYSIPGLGPRM